MIVNFKKILRVVFLSLSTMMAVVSPVFADGTKPGTTTATIPISVSGSDQTTVVIEKQVNGIFRKMDEKQVYRFGTLEVTEEDVGRYTYKIYQKNTGMVGVKYDDAVYMADVYVLIDEQSGNYSTETVVYHAGSLTKAETIAFINKSSPGPAPTATPSIRPTPSPTVSPSPIPTACPDCVVNPDGTVTRVDSDYTGDTSNLGHYFMVVLCISLAGIFIYAWRKDTKKVG